MKALKKPALGLVLSMAIIVALIGIWRGSGQNTPVPPGNETRTAAVGKEEPAKVAVEPVKHLPPELYAPAILRVGEPLECFWHEKPFPVKGSFLPPYGVERIATKIEMTDDQGRPVSFRNDREGASGVGGKDGTDLLCHSRLWPTEAHAQGQFWKPGVYFLQVVMEIKRNALEPELWHGRLVSNRVRVESVEPNYPTAANWLDDPAHRRSALGCVNDLNATEPSKR